MRNSKAMLSEVGYYAILVLTALVWGSIIALSFSSCGGGDDTYHYAVTNTTNCEQSIIIELTPAEAAEKEASGDLIGYMDNKYSIKAEEGEEETETGQTSNQNQQATITAEVCADDETTTNSVGNVSDGDVSVGNGKE